MSNSELSQNDSITESFSNLNVSNENQEVKLSMPQPKRPGVNIVDSLYYLDADFPQALSENLNHNFTVSKQYTDDIFAGNHGSIDYDSMEIYGDTSRPSSRLLNLFESTDSISQFKTSNSPNQKSFLNVESSFDKYPIEDSFNSNLNSTILNPTYIRPASTPVFPTNLSYSSYERVISGNNLVLASGEGKRLISKTDDEMSNGTFLSDKSSKLLSLNVNYFGPGIADSFKANSHTVHCGVNSNRRNNLTAVDQQAPRHHHHTRHPIHRSSSNIHTINSYRHSASPSLNMTSKHHHNNVNKNIEYDLGYVDALVTKTCKDILKDASNRCLKAVELANTLRARVGTEILALVRENWGGLLSLLERHGKDFRVDRIPKNDMVTLHDDTVMSSNQSRALSNDYLIDNLNHKEINDVLSDIRYQHDLIVSNEGVTVDDGNFESSNEGNVDGPNGALFESPSMQEISSQEYISGNMVSKCILISNVPINFNERDLIKELESYGIIDSYNMYIQRGQKFAFVSFRTIEMAVNAKVYMSKVSLWKNSISYANQDGNPGVLGFDRPVSPNFTGIWNDKSLASVPGISRPSSTSPYPQEMIDNMQSHQQNIRRNQSYNSVYNYIGDNLVSGNQVNSTYINTKSNSSLDHPSSFGSHFDQLYTGNSQFHQQPQLLNMSVLRRLCDDTYVPTQIWQKDPSDVPFCEAVTMQLMQFGGSTSISKLRGFLRSRINAPDNIKSVPLKAMLAAYPQLFVVRNNQVTLLNFSRPLSTLIEKPSGSLNGVVGLESEYLSIPSTQLSPQRSYISTVPSQQRNVDYNIFNHYS